MSSLLLSRIDTNLLYRPFLSKLTQLLDEALSMRKPYWVVSGHRSYVEQDKLYQIGRNVGSKQPRVTNAKGGQSAHNFGIAADVCLDGIIDRVGLQPDYRPGSYEPLRLLAPKYGLVWGGAWGFPDRPHLQMPGWVTSTDMEPLRFCYDTGGLASVWAFMDLA